MKNQKVKVVEENTGRQATALSEFKVKGVTSAVCFVVGMLSIASAHAQIVSDKRAGKGPEVTTTTNGTPLVNINAASPSAGVSVNQYREFSTDARGVVLNNSPTDSQTQLGGLVRGNANLGGRAARIIINQVTGNMPSNLVGNIEVAGQRAEVVLSNPNGIAVNGAGFINTSRAVLTTGEIVFGKGNGKALAMDKIEMKNGEIVVNNLNDSGTDQIDLIARAVKINGEIHAKNDLNVIAGNADVHYSDSEILWGTVSKKVPSPAPVVAIDVAALGGMYAKKIKLVGTEEGVGVNIAGTVSAEHDLTLQSSGRLSIAGTVSAGNDLLLSSAGRLSIDSKGRADSGGLIDITVYGDALVNEGTIASKGDIAVDTRDNTVVTNAATGVLQADGNIKLATEEGINQAGKVVAGGSVAVKGYRKFYETSNATNFTNSGVIKASDIRMDQVMEVRNTNTGVLSATNSVEIVGTRNSLNEGVVTGDRITVKSSDQLVNAATGVFSGSKVGLYSFGDLTNSGTVAVKKRGAMSLMSIGTFVNTGELKVGGEVNPSPLKTQKAWTDMGNGYKMISDKGQEYIY